MDLQTCLKTSLRTKYQKLLDPPVHDSLLRPRFCCRAVDSFFSNQHDIRHVDKSAFHTCPVYTELLLEEILSCDCRHHSSQRTVITVGVSGVGKTTAVQSSAVDWAAGWCHRNIDLLFPLTFWELNLIKKKVSFMKLLQMFYPELKQLSASSLRRHNVWFVLDGLEDFKLPLNFSGPSVSDVSEESTVDVLVTSLIRGDLLPSAHVWMTTHSSAAAQIPRCYLLKETSLEGFHDWQKEQRFRHIISQEDLVIKAIDHVKVWRSLNFLCEIPPICTIMASVLKKHLNPNPVYKIIPLSLTQIYTKLTEASNPDTLAKLEKLATLQPDKGNVMYNDDLLEAGISAEEASAFSKECPLVLTEETGLNDTTVFRFGHSSIREFFTASAKLDEMAASEDMTLSESIQRLVDEALHSPEGKLDLILRFIFGLVKDRRLLEPSDALFDYTKRKILENIVLCSSTCLLHCLREYDRQAFLSEVRNYIKYGITSGYESEAMDWKYLCQMTRTFEGMRDSFELHVSMRCDENLLRHLPVILKTNMVTLRFSNLTVKSCPSLGAVLGTKESYLRELDLGYNSLGDEGALHLLDGLRHPHCRLQCLRLQGCGLTSRTCDDLATALLLTETLCELDLSRNDIGDDGMRKLLDGLRGEQCKLEVLRLSQCNIELKGCKFLAKALVNFRYLRHLDLSINMIQDYGANKLCECFHIWKLSKLELYHCGLTARSCRNIGKALRHQSCRLQELNLSNNKLKDEGLKRICEDFNPFCSLERLHLTRCGITADSCALLAQVLTQVVQIGGGGRQQAEYRGVALYELDLSKNRLGDKGVHILSAVLQNPNSNLMKLNLSRCSLTERSCADLALGLALGHSPLWELDLSGNELKDKGVMKLCVALRSSLCQLSKLELRSCCLTSKIVSFLTSALKSNQNLVELHLMGNKVDDSDITALMELKHNPKHVLQTLDFPAD